MILFIEVSISWYITVFFLHTNSKFRKKDEERKIAHSFQVFFAKTKDLTLSFFDFFFYRIHESKYPCVRPLDASVTWYEAEVCGEEKWLEVKERVSEVERVE